MKVIKKVVLNTKEKQTLETAINKLASIECIGIKCEDCPLAIVFEYDGTIIDTKCVKNFLKEINKNES